MTGGRELHPEKQVQQPSSAGTSLFFVKFKQRRLLAAWVLSSPSYCVIQPGGGHRFELRQQRLLSYHNALAHCNDATAAKEVVGVPCDNLANTHTSPAVTNAPCATFRVTDAFNAQHYLVQNPRVHFALRPLKRGIFTPGHDFRHYQPHHSSISI